MCDYIYIFWKNRLKNLPQMTRMRYPSSQSSGDHDHKQRCLVGYLMLCLLMLHHRHLSQHAHPVFFSFILQFSNSCLASKPPRAPNPAGSDSGYFTTPRHRYIPNGFIIFPFANKWVISEYLGISRN